MDIGVSSTLLPLVGERIDDYQLIADYVASLRPALERAERAVYDKEAEAARKQSD